jgi:hypothetical protein
MAGVLKSSLVTYEFTPLEIRQLIAADLQVDENKINVTFVIEEVGGDPMDRFRGTDTVTKIRVTVSD